MVIKESTMGMIKQAPDHWQHQFDNICKEIFSDQAAIIRLFKTGFILVGRKPFMSS